MNTDTSSQLFNFQAGELLLINKPFGWTSFNVVSKIRHLLKHHTGIKRIKVGHAGTLDPLANGLLIICTGKFTKKIDEFQGLEKEYTGSFTLGKTTPSFDAETEIDKNYPTEHITEKLIKNTAKEFIGTIEQMPPVYSAIKIDGKRAYEYARKNEKVTIKPKLVSISEFEITSVEMPIVKFRVVCSKGTYIRSLANDFGIRLGSGAYLTALTRTRIGNYKLKDSIEPDAFKEMLIHLKKTTVS